MHARVHPPQLGPGAVPSPLADGKTEAMGFEHGTPLLQSDESDREESRPQDRGVACGGCPFPHRQQRAGWSGCFTFP